MKPTPANLLMMQFTFLGGSFLGVCIDVYMYIYIYIISIAKTQLALSWIPAKDQGLKIWEVPNIGVITSTAGWFIKWRILLKWMIWGYPYFRKPTYGKNLVKVREKRNKWDLRFKMIYKMEIYGLRESWLVPFGICRNSSKMVAIEVYGKQE
jgi:hypothetical protein